MRQTLQTIGLLLLLLITPVVAQEKPTPAEKLQPAVTLPPDASLLSAQDSAAKAAKNLPKFELERFVITGVALIDVGDVEKLPSDDHRAAPELANPLNAPRDRLTADFPRGGDLEGVVSPHGFNGRIVGSVGTYLTSHFGLWLSTRNDDDYVFGSFEYGSSRAYVPSANHSEGHVGVTGGMTLNGPLEWYDRGVLEGSVGYGSKSYRFFGSLTPAIIRTTTDVELSAKFSTPISSPTRYNALAGMTVAGFSDSSRSVTETRFDLGVGYGFLLGDAPLDARLGLSLVSTNGSGEGTLPFFDGGLKTQKFWWGGFFLQGSVQFYVTQGMIGQKFARLYPQVEVGYRVLESTVLSAAYLGHVQFNSLRELAKINPYVDATATIRQTDVPIDMLGALETAWSGYLQTRLAFHYQSMRNYPLFTEGGRKGIWTPAYFGTTELSTIEADLFAKLNANMYFTLSLSANSSKNSVTDWKIPYIPDVQLDAILSVEVANRLRILPAFTVVDRRATDVNPGDRLKPYVLVGLRGEYSILRRLDVFLDLQNLTDSNYDIWKSYRAAPFVASAGLRICW